MTIDEFIAELAKTPREWFLDEGRIRCIVDLRPTCPVCRVADRPSSRAMDAGGFIGLLDSTIDDLMTAADHSDVGTYLTPLRERMLAACGLA